MTNKVNPLVSFIIIYTNDKQLKECNKWIDAQDYQGEIEKIILDNRENKAYNSASSALNDGARKSKGDILFFMHQDIYLWDKSAITRIVDYLNDNKEAIVGAAGIATSDGFAHFDIDMRMDGKKYAWGTNGENMEAYTLDECLLVMLRQKWEQLKFDEVTCDNWHFYGADICMSNILHGGKNIIFPLHICHDSFGSPESEAFKESAYKIAEKYRGKFDRLSTTCIDAKCSKKGVDHYFRKINRRKKTKAFFKKIGLYKVVKKINNYRCRRKGYFIPED